MKPVKLCECGCGLPAPIAAKNLSRSGAVKGQPQRFVKGHNARGSLAPWWKGDEVGYAGLHRWLRENFPKTGRCDECGEAKPTDFALKQGREHSRRRENYRELCRGCHIAYDGTGGSRWRK